MTDCFLNFLRQIVALWFCLRVGDVFLWFRAISICIALPMKNDIARGRLNFKRPRAISFYFAQISFSTLHQTWSILEKC